MQDSFNALGLDISQLFANFLGFSLFLWLMAKYAWKPILAFMDQRQEEIAGNFRKIEHESQELAKIRQEYEDRLAKIEEEATKRIQEAIRQGQDIARDIEEQAHIKAQSIIEKSRADITRMLEQARLEFRNYLVEIGIEAGRKATMGVLDESTHKRMIERYIEELYNVR